MKDVQQEAERELAPVSRIAITVARARAERGDDVGPNVTLILLATIDSRDQRIKELEDVIEDFRRGAKVYDPPGSR